MDYRENMFSLTGHQLKIIACICMVLDHIHQMFNRMGAPIWLTMVGRVVAPIFLYLSTEGFHHTRDRRAYLFRLWIFSVLMNLGNMAISYLFPMDDVVLMNSMFGTIFLSVYYMCVVDEFKQGLVDRSGRTLILSISGIILPIILGFVGFLLVDINLNLFRLFMVFIPSIFLVEGGPVWIAMGLVMYNLRDRGKIVQLSPIVILSALVFMNGDRVQPFMVLSVIPLYLYRGRIGKKTNKYFFYIFYPTHIYILYILAYLVDK